MKRYIVSTLTVLLLSGGALGVAAEREQTTRPQKMEGHIMEGGMMEGGMMNLMGMCRQMMDGGMMTHILPQLPPGNEKLRLQMDAEMMQKLGGNHC